MPMNERQIGVAIQILMMLGLAAISILQYSYVPQTTTLIRLGCFLILVLTLTLYLRKFPYASIGAILCGCILIPLVVEDGGYHPSNPYVLLLPAIAAMILTRPQWVAIAGILTPVLFLVLRPGTFLWDVSTFYWVLYSILIGAFILARLLAEIRLKQIRQANGALQAAHTELEQHSLALAEANSKQQTQLNEQQRLLALITLLETPVVHIAEEVLLVPIIGHMDSTRLQRLNQSVLSLIHTQQVRLVVLDISGVTLIDTQIAQKLIETARAIQLLGCDVVFSGISAKVALTITQLGLGTQTIKAVQRPQDALALFKPSVAER